MITPTKKTDVRASISGVFDTERPFGTWGQYYGWSQWRYQMDAATTPFSKREKCSRRRVSV